MQYLFHIKLFRYSGATNETWFEQNDLHRACAALPSANATYVYGYIDSGSWTETTYRGAWISRTSLPSSIGQYGGTQPRRLKWSGRMWNAGSGAPTGFKLAHANSEILAARATEFGIRFTVVHHVHLLDWTLPRTQARRLVSALCDARCAGFIEERLKRRRMPNVRHWVTADLRVWVNKQRHQKRAIAPPKPTIANLINRAIGRNGA